jgi:hypothetical protein
VTPTATLAQAAELLQANGIQPSEKMQVYTVYSVVQELLLFLLCKASDYPASGVVEAVAEKVVQLLGGCGSAALDSVALQEMEVKGADAGEKKAAAAKSSAVGAAGNTHHAKTPPPTTTATGGRALKDLTVAEVGELMVRSNFKKLQALFAENEVSGRRLANCDGYEDLMDEGVGVTSKVLAKELMELIAEWKEAGVPE